MARPTKLPKVLEEGYWKQVGRSATRRTMRNCYFEDQAFMVLHKNGMENFRFLYDPDKEGKELGRSFIKKTILCELGKLADDEILLKCARHICDHKMKAGQAVTFTRAFRLLHGSRNEYYKHSDNVKK